MTIKTQTVTTSNAQLLATYEAMRKLGESGSKDQNLAKKFARIIIILEAKVRLYQTTRNNLIRSNAVRDENGEIVYMDQYQQSPRMRWEFQSELADLENDTVSFRCERISDDELGETCVANMLVALNPLFEQSLMYEQDDDGE